MSAATAHRVQHSSTFAGGVLPPPNALNALLPLTMTEAAANGSIATDQPHNSAPKHDDIQDHEYPGGLRLAAIVFALVLGIFLASLDTTIITTAIPSITNDFHSLQDVGWYASALFFSVAATQSMWGKAYKYFPVKPVFLFSIFVFELGSLVCGNYIPFRLLRLSEDINEY